MPCKKTGRILNENQRLYLQERLPKSEHSNPSKINTDCKRIISDLPDTIKRFFDDYQTILYSYNLWGEKQKQEIEETITLMKTQFNIFHFNTEDVFPFIKSPLTAPKFVKSPNYKKAIIDITKKEEAFLKTAKKIATQKYKKETMLLIQIFERTKEGLLANSKKKTEEQKSPRDARTIIRESDYFSRSLNILEKNGLIELRGHRIIK